MDIENRFAKHGQRFDQAMQERHNRFARWAEQAPIVKAELEQIALWLTLHSQYFRQVGVNVHETHPQLVTDREVILQARDIKRITLEVGDFDLADFSAQSSNHNQTLRERGFALQFNPTWNGKIYAVVTGYARDYNDEVVQEILHICDDPRELDAAHVHELLDKALEFAVATCHLFEGNASEPIHLARIGFKSNGAATE
jgi:hypothetical protein